MKYCFILFLIAVSLTVSAQEEDYNNELYTLVEDHIFPKLHHFYGYSFVPNQGKLAFAHYPDPVPEGWVEFKVTKRELEVKEQVIYRPGGIIEKRRDLKPYKLRITKVEDKGGYIKLELAKLADPDLTGYVMFYRNGYSQIRMMKFKPGPGAHERIYLFKYATEEQLEADSKYFTHQEDHPTDDPQYFWKNTLTLYPFHTFENYDNLYTIDINRLRPEDGLNINFFERKIVLKKKEKINQYISVVERGEKKIELLLKKAYEVLVYHRDGERHATQLECVNEITKDEYYIVLHRGKKTYLKAFEVQKKIDKKTTETIMYYEMRRGKSPEKETTEEDAPQDSTKTAKTPK